MGTSGSRRRPMAVYAVASRTHSWSLASPAGLGMLRNPRHALLETDVADALRRDPDHHTPLALEVHRIVGAVVTLRESVDVFASPLRRFECDRRSEERRVGKECR